MFDLAIGLRYNWHDKKGFCKCDVQSGVVFWVTIYVNYILILFSAYIKMSNLGVIKGIEKPKLGKLNNAKELKETETEFKN